MAIPKITAYAFLGLALGLGSCAAPKAIVIAAAPTAKKEEKKAPEPIVSGPLVPGLPNDGIRMPDMLAMPNEGEFRATNPTSPKTSGESGAVTVRPPTDPPSRVKPKVDQE